MSTLYDRVRKAAVTLPSAPVATSPVVANKPAVVANSRKGDRHANPEARKAYQADLMRKRRAAAKGSK